MHVNRRTGSQAQEHDASTLLIRRATLLATDLEAEIQLLLSPEQAKVRGLQHLKRCRKVRFTGEVEPEVIARAVAELNRRCTNGRARSFGRDGIVIRRTC